MGAGLEPETFRLHRTGRVVAFGRHDQVTAGYTDAVAAARAAGYLPVARLAGGRAAVFHEDTLAFSWAIPDPEPRARIVERFRTVSRLLADAFGDLGADVRVGELPGEYCPGAYSVHLEGDRPRKVMGVGQRLVRGAAHVGGVIVVDGGRRVADALQPVYRALGVAWNPQTSGDLTDQIGPVSHDEVTDAVVARLDAVRGGVERVALSVETARQGAALAPDHVAPAAANA